MTKASLVERGWLIADGGNVPRFRFWDEWGAHWTDDPSKAIRLARRADAEQLAAGDEDAWSLVEYLFDTSAGTAIEVLPTHTRVTNLKTLTAGEAAVITLASAGYPNKTIAVKLRISANAVEQRKMRVKRKLAIGNCVQWMSFLKEFQP